jgi:hypothetical protein
MVFISIKNLTADYYWYSLPVSYPMASAKKKVIKQFLLNKIAGCKKLVIASHWQRCSFYFIRITW